ncbi:MAG: MBL fold metallo-hydrolase [Clostridia bacterium]|nr:MBL fold metallo-hydrolase [Clostridia bacterium]
MARSRRKSKSKQINLTLVIIAVVILAALFALEYFGVIDVPFIEFVRPHDHDHQPVITDGELQIHFIELGNKYTGDCTYIKAGDTDILIDAGSRTSSISTISNYIDKYCTDGSLEYVIVTHAHQDHYAGFAGDSKNPSLFTKYECGTIIDFARTNQSETGTMYSNYQKQLQSEIDAGATHYTAAEVRQSGKYTFELADGITLEILDSYYYYNDSDDENNYSVCCMIHHGEANFLFTGDLEKDGEKHLVEMNDLPEVELYKAGHHGSKTSSNDALLSVIKPKIVCVCCCAGSSEYTSVNESMFPTQAFVDRIAKYTDRVYVTTLCVDYKNDQFTSMNGNITVSSSKDGITVACSNNTTVLKDTEWFKKNRTCPDAWK